MHSHLGTVFVEKNKIQLSIKKDVILAQAAQA